MNFCPNCGTKLKTGLNYCSSCGYVFKEENKPEYNETEGPAENVSGSYKDAASALDREAEEAERRKKYEEEEAAKRARRASEERSYSYSSGSNYNTGYMDTAPKTNVYGIISLVCGILGIPLFFLLLIPSILAVIFGIMGLNFAKNNISGRGMSIAGIILGLVVIVIFILAIALSVAVFSIIGGGAVPVS